MRNNNSYIKYNNYLVRKARKKEWNNLVRYCENCFYQLKDNEEGASHPLTSDCIKASKSNLKQDPQLFKKLAERQING